MAKGPNKSVDLTDTVTVHIKAAAVHEVAPGVFAVHMPARRLEPKQTEVIRELFPNLSERVYEVLSQESLLSSLTDPPEAPTPEIMPREAPNKW